MLKHHHHRLHSGSRFLYLEIVFIFDIIIKLSLNHVWSIPKFVITPPAKNFLDD